MEALAGARLAFPSQPVTGMVPRLPTALGLQGRPFSGSGQRRGSRLAASPSPGESEASSTAGAPKGEDLASKLAAAEAEAEALRKELAQRKSADALAGAKGTSKKPYVDGIGYRETIFMGPLTRGKLAKKDGGSGSWDFSEAELLQSEGGLEKLMEQYGVDSDERPIGREEAQRIIQRRLLIGAGMSAVVAALAYIDIPVTVAPPQKPLNIYLVPLLRLQASLDTVLEQAEFLDALGLRAQLKLATGSMSAVKDNILNVTALLDSNTQPAGRSLAFAVLDYLEQADSSKYFEGMGLPGASQEAEYISFSIKSLKVAKERLGSFLALVPNGALETAKAQLEGQGQLPSS